MADGNTASTATDKTAQLANSLVSFDQVAVQRAGLGIEKGKLDLATKVEDRRKIETEMQLDTQKSQHEEMIAQRERESVRTADTAIEQTEAVQKGFKDKRAADAEENDKRRVHERNTLVWQATKAEEMRAKEREEVKADRLQEKIDDITAEIEVAKVAAKQVKNNFDVLEVMKQMEDRKAEMVQAQQKLSHTLVERAEEFASWEPIWEGLGEEMVHLVGGALAENADMFFRTHSRTGSWWPTVRMTPEGGRFDMYDYMYNNPDLVDANGEIRINDLDAYRESKTNYETQTETGPIGPGRAKAIHRGLGAGEKRGEISGAQRMVHEGAAMAGAFNTTKYGQQIYGTDWAYPNRTEGERLKPKEVLEFIGAEAADSMRDLLAEMGKKTGVPDLPARFHTGFRVLTQAASSNDAAKARDIIKERIIDAGLAVPFSRYVQTIAASSRGALKQMEAEARGRGTGDDKATKKLEGDAAQEIKAAVKEMNNSLVSANLILDEVGITTMRASGEELKSMVNWAIENRDPEIFANIAPQKLEKVFEAFPEARALFEEFMEDLGGWTDLKTEKERREIEAPDRTIENRIESLETRQKYYQDQMVPTP